MSRLIDADNAKQELSLKLYVHHGLDAAEQAIKIIDAQPTADAIAVIRCSNCRYYNASENIHGVTVTACEYRAPVWTEPNGYCYRGKKKEAD